MDLEIIILSEVSQTEEDKNHMILLICGSKKNSQINLQNKNKLIDIENELMAIKGEEGVINWEYGINRYT